MPKDAAGMKGYRPRNKNGQLRDKRDDTHIGTIEKQYGVNLDTRPDMHLGEYLRRHGIESLNDLIKGNSGGPVYFIDSNRYYAGAPHLGKIQFIAGLVSKEFNVEEAVKSLYEIRQQVHPLGLAIVIHASHILDTVNLLPDQEAEIKQEQK